MVLCQNYIVCITFEDEWKRWKMFEYRVTWDLIDATFDVVKPFESLNKFCSKFLKSNT